MTERRVVDFIFNKGEVDIWPGTKDRALNRHLKATFARNILKIIIKNIKIALLFGGEI